ncbi:glycosyltransferase [Candidatus Magnetomonas plexicatena]|uniref:glycosyltransferase n=1 Tax=Candidatus Magnetomonas plexicatena TaxID=2552947 RepID=UPI001C78B810|nr:glycosyltransferase family 4 protein [Nitrospirales bacterium LBB_01]
MHVFYVGTPLPFDGRAGGYVHSWAIVNYLLKHGHKVTVFVLADTSSDTEGIKILSGMGVEVVTLFDVRQREHNRPTYKKFLAPQIEDYFPLASMSAEKNKIILEYISKQKPHVIFAFGIAALAVTDGIKTLPKVSFPFEDLINILYNDWRYNKPFNNLRQFVSNTIMLLNSIRIQKQMVTLHIEAELSGVVAGQKYRIFQNLIDKSHCKHYTTALSDPMAQTPKESIPVNNVKKILFVGQFNTPTRLGLAALYKDVLPALTKNMGQEKFKIHLVGENEFLNFQSPHFKFSNYRWLKELLAHPCIEIRGYVEDIGYEFLSSDILLVPTPIQAGLRGRIVAGLAYGSCIVTTKEEQASLPELVHMENALIASNFREMASLIAMALEDDELRERVGKNARLVYEKNFTPDVSVKKIVDDMTGVVKEFKYPEGCIPKD